MHACTVSSTVLRMSAAPVDLSCRVPRPLHAIASSSRSRARSTVIWFGVDVTGPELLGTALWPCKHTSILVHAYLEVV